MSVNFSVRDRLPEGTVIFEGSAYDNSIIGVTLDGRAIYSFEKMVEELIEDNGWSYDESVEWVEYNTIRAIPYAGSKAPLIVYE